MADVLRFDLAKDPKGNPIVYGRVGDGGSFTREVRVFEDGKPLDLTGWTTTFEGNTNKYQTKVFDSYGIKILNAKNGEFSYTFPNMAFAVEGQYERAYFSFTNGDKRKSTGNFEIIVLGNADIDAPEAETIITEYNKLIAELQELQKNNIADLQEQAETIQTRLSELAKRLDELELGVRLHDAYAWSADGTDRFTKVYPRENLVKDSLLSSGANYPTTHSAIKAVSADTPQNMPYKYAKNIWKVTKSATSSYGYITHNFSKEISENLEIKLGEYLTVSALIYVPNDVPIGTDVFKIGKYDSNWLNGNIKSYNDRGKWGTISHQFAVTDLSFLIAVGFGGSSSLSQEEYSFWIAGFKLEKGQNDNPIVTPAPSDDPINAYPTYKGISIVDSDNPADYSWQAEDNTIAKKATLDSHTENISNPHKVTKTQIGLGNVDNYSTATQTEAEAGAATNKYMTPFTTKKLYLNETKARRQKWDEGLNWIAHRGNNTDFPENSIAAFQNARRHWGIETDIQVTSDGKWVIMHDGTVDRTTNGTGAVSSMTFEQFRTLRIDTGANIAALTDVEKTPPTLEEYLLVCKQLNKVPVIEIKSGTYSTANYTLLKDTLNLFGYGETNCVIASFDYAVLTSIRTIYPNMELHMFVNAIDTTVINQLTTLGIPAAASCSYSNASVTSANIKLLHAAGLKVGVWTVPDNNFDSMVKIGVDYVTTNSLSGNLKFAFLELLNGFTNNADNGRLRGSYVEQTGSGECLIDFNVQDGTVNTQNSPFAQLPNWAIPTYRTFAACTVRVSTDNGNIVGGSFDLNGRLVPTSATAGTLGIGLNWTNRTSWAAGVTPYKI